MLESPDKEMRELGRTLLFEDNHLTWSKFREIRDLLHTRGKAGIWIPHSKVMGKHHWVLNSEDKIHEKYIQVYLKIM